MTGRDTPAPRATLALPSLSSGTLNLPAVGCEWHFTPSSGTEGKAGTASVCSEAEQSCSCQSTPGAPAPAAQQENKAVQEKKGKRRILLHSCDPAQEASGPEWGFRESLPFL